MEPNNCKNIKHGRAPHHMKDIIIIGSGPAGMTAAIYAQRYGMQATVISPAVGGNMVNNPEIENYPGIPHTSGQDIAEKMKAHAEGLGAEFMERSVTEVQKLDAGFLVKTDWGEELPTQTVVMATGLKARELPAKNEKKFRGKGVSYCAICDGAFFKDQVVAVVGGRDSAAVAALILAEFAKQVYIIYRRDKFTQMKVAHLKQVQENPKIEPVFNENVVECLGDDKLTGVKLESGKTMDLDGLFVEIGYIPCIPFETQGFSIKTNPKGVVEVGQDMCTSTPGFYAAGDITTGSNHLRQIITAASEGARASASAHLHWLEHRANQSD